MSTDDEERIARRHMHVVIRRFRDAAGFSQQQLADRIGVSKGFISGLEGGRNVPNLDMLVRIARELGVSPGEMLDAMLREAERQ